MKVVHYTNKEGWTLLPIKIENHNNNKPKAALWTSPILSGEYGWREWCAKNMYSNGMHAIRLTLNIERIFVIDCRKDMMKMPWKKVDPKVDFLWACDYVAMAKEYDAIWLTAIGEYDTRQLGDFPNLYGWDCETVCILNERCILNYEKEMIEA